MSVSESTSLVINAVQQAWLQELGIERSHLQRLGASVIMLRQEPAKQKMQSLEAAPELLEPLATAQAEKKASVVSSATTVTAGSVQAAIQALRQAAGIRQTTPVQDESPAAVQPSAVPMPDDFSELAHAVQHCQACSLHQMRSQAVFGKGQPQARWLVIADAPGDVDDRHGVAFDGQAGELLRAMLSSVGLSDEGHCFITHLVKCRPLNNRTPASEEIHACSPYTLKQIALMEPNFILALGQLAANQLLNTQDDIEALRQKVHHWSSPQGKVIPLIVTYHPAALLLRPQHKANAWRDLALVNALNQQG